MQIWTVLDSGPQAVREALEPDRSHLRKRTIG